MNKKLNRKLQGRKGEEGFEDDWKNKGGSDYTGRIYGLYEHPFPPKLDPSRPKLSQTHTWSFGEVTTMGLQRLFENPAGFHREDPEFFEWIVDNMQRPAGK